MAPKKKAPLTDDEKHQLSLLQEVELTSLRRRCTNMDKDMNRNYYTRGKGASIEKSLGIFEREYMNLSTDLDVATTKEKRADDRKTMVLLGQEVDTVLLYEDEVKKQKILITEVEGEIRRVKKSVIALTAHQTTDRQHMDRIKHAFVTLETLENKLEVQVRKFCAICSKNRELRETLHHYLKEREFFMVYWEKILLRLQKGKKIMLDLIEQATIAYDQREEWCTKLTAIKLKAKKELCEYTHRMQSLNRAGDYNVKLDDFMSVKNQIRNMRRLRLKEKVRLFEKTTKMRAEFRRYQNMIEDIEEFCHENQLSVIIREFRKTECYNFSTFSFINDATYDTERFCAKLNLLQLQIDEERVQHEERAKQQKEKLGTLEIALSDLLEHNSLASEKLTKFDANLKEMMTGIGILFKICKAKNDPILKLLANSSGKVTQFNVILFIKILESKILNQFLVLNYYECAAEEKKHSGKLKQGMTLSKTDVDEITLFGIEDLIDVHPCALCVERDVITEVIDCLQVVWSREKAAKKLKIAQKSPDAISRLHRVSKCTLPKARAIVQRRYM